MNGNDLVIEYVINHRWWDEGHNEHVDSATLVFNERGEYTYSSMHVIDYKVPQDFTSGPMGNDSWEHKDYEADLIIIRPEIKYANGKIKIVFSMHFLPIEDGMGGFLEYISSPTFFEYVTLG